jgi:hypothetical protein
LTKSTQPAFQVEVGSDAGASVETDGVSVAIAVSVESGMVGNGVGSSALADGIGEFAAAGGAVEATPPQAIEDNTNPAMVRIILPLALWLIEPALVFITTSSLGICFAFTQSLQIVRRLSDSRLF